MNDELVEEFTDGVNAYFAGVLPVGWNSIADRETDPYLMGWYLASQADTGQEYNINA